MEKVETDIRVLMSLSHRTACDKGWWDMDRTFGDQIALMHSELSDALREFRTPDHSINKLYQSPYNRFKPEGVAVEFADVLIRIFDICEHYDIPLVEAITEKMAYNKTRPYMHGNKAI